MSQGAVTAVEKPMRALAQMLPDQLRERIASDPFPELWVSAFRARLARGERDAVRLYPELLRMVGANDAALEIAMRALDIASIEQGKRLLDMARGVDGMTDQELESKAVTFLRQSGWTCLPPSAEVGTRTSGPTGGAAPPVAMTPGAETAKDGANGSSH